MGPATLLVGGDGRRRSEPVRRSGQRPAIDSMYTPQLLARGLREVGPREVVLRGSRKMQSRLTAAQ
jgi:hypothetical protein